VLNADDPQTIYSIRLLRETVARERPVVIWVGAGASRWLGYPSWEELARGLRFDFFKSVAGFENSKAVNLIQSGKYADFFQLCKNLDRARYFTYLSNAFLPKTHSNTYLRFTDLLRRLSPLYIVTTNVDESLERIIADPPILQNTDLTRAVELLNTKSSFIAKLHGSCSSIEKVVFASDDYARLVQQNNFIATIKYIFTSCSVLFLGYSVRDQYVLELLKKNAHEMDLFGSGPHFVVTNQNDIPIPKLRTIRYSTALHPDHRAAMSVLDLLHESIQLTSIQMGPHIESDAQTAKLEDERMGKGKTGYFISDFKPAGTWASSQSGQAARQDGEKIEFTIGLGFTNDEVPFSSSTALHDLVVGLICFDTVYLPVQAVGAAHQALTPNIFWELVNSESVRFVHSLHEPSAIFNKRIPEPFGAIVSLTLRDSDGVSPMTASKLIRQNIVTAPGKEAEGEALIEGLVKRCVTFEKFQWELPTEVRGSLLMPSVSRLLGIGDAIIPSQVPRWLTFPYLRMAHLVQTGMICASLGLKAAKVPFGGKQLINGAFGIRTETEFAEQAASFVLSGNYDTDLGAIVQQDLSIIRSILKFRQSQGGESFRKEVFDILSVPLGTEFAASVNAGLRQSIPTSVLQKAKNRLSFLLTNHAKTIATPAVWGNTIQSDRVTQYWRAKSLKLLMNLCESRGIGKNDDCICGSGEKLRLCCLPPLRS